MKNILVLLSTVPLALGIVVLSVVHSFAEQIDAVSAATVAAEPCVADFDCNGMVGVSDLFIFLGEFGRNPLKRPCRQCVVSPLPQSGQTVSVAVGDDGNVQAGVTWPEPRFTENYTCG